MHWVPTRETSSLAGTITRLVFQRSNAQRVNVHLDGRYAFAVPAVEAAQLRLGQFLSDAEIGRLRDLDARQRAYDRVLRLLSHRPRSEAEVSRYLRRRDTPPDVVEEVMTRLRGQGYLDDEAFVAFWIENRERFKPRGPRALRHELRQKGVERRLIDQGLQGLDVSDSAYRAAQPRLRRWSHLEQGEFRQKALGYLARRGFPYGVANEVVERLWKEQEEDQDT